MSAGPATAAAPAQEPMTAEELEAFLEQLPRPLRNLGLLRDIYDQDAAHKRHRKTGSLTVVIHWDDLGDPKTVTLQPSPVSHQLTPPPRKA